jgi:hypothetical protein
MSKIRFILIVFLVSLAIVVANFRFLHLAGGDVAIYINPASMWNDIRYAWSPNLINQLGWSNISFGLVMPFVIFFKIFSFLPNIAAEYIYFSLIFCAVFFSSFYFFYNYLFSKNKYISVISSLTYVLNGFFFVYFLNYNSHLSFIILPLLFILCHQLMENNFKKLIIVIFLISIFIPSAFVNPPVVLPLFLAAFSYIILLITKRGGINRKIAINILVSIAYFILFNLWWILPFVYTSFSNSISNKIGGAIHGSIFRTTSLHDAFRFLGKWSFGNYYLDYKGSTQDYLFLSNPIFILCNFFVLVLAYWSVIYKKNKNIFYFIFLSLAGLFFTKGDLAPFGDWYMIFLSKFPLGYIFREPQAKFMIIHVFSISVLLGCLLLYLKNSGSPSYRKIYFLMLLVILVPSISFLSGGFTPKGCFGPIRSFLVKIPEYMIEYKNFQKSKKLEYRVLSTPRNTGLYLWDSGFDVNDSALKYLSNEPVLSFGGSVVDYFTPELNSIFKSVYGNLEKSENPDIYGLGLINVREIVQENSKDWRWSDVAKKPGEMDLIFKNLKERNFIDSSAEFGYFSPDYLSKINLGVPENVNIGKLPSTKNRLELLKTVSDELTNRPGISINRTRDEFFIPRFYVPKDIIISERPVEELYRILIQNDFNIRSAVYFKDQNTEKNSDIENIITGETGEEKEPVLEFKKINPTKYVIRAHGARSIFPLIFSENFHPGWKTYLNQNANIKMQNDNSKLKIDNYKILNGNEDDQASKEELSNYIQKRWITDLGNGREKLARHMKWDSSKQKETMDYTEKFNVDFISKNFQGTIQNDNLPSGNFWETWLKKPIADEKSHLKANGYANSWIIDPAKTCKNNNNCSINPDGSYEMEFIVEFWPQRLFYAGMGISGATLLACLGYLFYNRRKKNLSKKYEIAE